jgi:hypothetical protein
MRSRAAAVVLGDPDDPRVRLAELFGGTVPAAGQPPAPALDWARAVLERIGAHDELTAIRDLRTAEPRLPLKAATFLAKHALARL